MAEDKKNNDTTLKGAIPGAINTQGQFQVWAKIKIEELLEKDRKQGEEIKDDRTEVKSFRVAVEAAMESLRKEVTDKLTVMHNRQNAMDKENTELKTKVGTLYKIVGALGTGLVSVIGSLLVWYLTKG